MRFNCLWIASLAGASVILVGGAFQGLSMSPETPEKSAGASSYDAAVWNPLHFAPAIDTATNEQCLVCHQEVLEHTPRKASPAGVESSKSAAWYQTLGTYEGAQQSFHYRHLQSAFAKQVMNLNCNFCHRGHDPRDEAPGTSATGSSSTNAQYTLRKVVDPTQTCLRCHGSFPHEIMGLPGPWHETRESFEDENVKNGCLDACHKTAFRTNRHQVTYLNGAKIEEQAKEGSDVCFGCHGGRAWYKNSYPYPRTPWPDMGEEVPDWAKDRPTQSEARYRTKGNK